MKQLLRLGLIYLLCGPLQAQATITLVADRWCPYNCEPGTEFPGYVVEIATEIFAQHDVDVDYRVIPWSRAVTMTRAGLFNGIIGAIPIEAEDFLFGRESIGKVRHTLYTLPADDWTFQSLTSLSTIRLGAIQDYSYGSEVTAYINTHRHLDQVSVIGGTGALARLVQMLQSGRIDAMIEDRSVLQYHLNSVPSMERPVLREAGTAAMDDIYIAFSPANPASEQYRQWLDEGVRALRDSGRLSVILKRYGLTEW